MEAVTTILTVLNTGVLVWLLVRYSKFRLKVYKGFADKEDQTQQLAIALDDKFKRVKKVTDSIIAAIDETNIELVDTTKKVNSQGKDLAKQSNTINQKINKDVSQLKDAIQDLIEDTDRRIKDIEKS